MNILEVQNLYKSFGEIEVLKGVSLNVQQGDIIAVIGPSGSGKSTLLRCINCLEYAEHGTITLDGITIAQEVDGKTEYLRDEKLLEARLHLGMVFQNFNLFPHLSVLENVTLAPINVRKQDKSTAEARARELLGKVGLSDKANAYPCELSGGQQQRVAIARALALDPHLLCFDEPTSALDPQLTGEVLSVIKDLAKERMTMLIVTHEMGFARDVSSEVIFMDDGRIQARGTPEEILVNPAQERICLFLNKVLGS